MTAGEEKIEIEKVKEIEEIEREVVQSISEEDRELNNKNKYQDGFFYFSDYTDYSKNALMPKACIQQK